ncbi:MAG: MATE family efflux transporter [Clostridia bacterium]|nr:MATE family efflux transporter [Clostridia bacterium]
MKLGTNLTEGSIFKKFCLFVVPVILSGFLQQLYNTADTIVVGRFAGDTALAAVGATTVLTNLIVTLFIGLSVGTNVVCARFFGSENKEGIERALYTSVVLGIVLGIPLTFVGWFGSEYFLSLMGTPSDIIKPAALYMKLYFLGVPATLIYNFGSAVLRALGDTKRPLYILTVAGIVNVILNLICVIGFGLDVVGVAIGTIASQVLSAIAVIAIFMQKAAEPRFRFSKLRTFKKELIMILAIGLPSGLNGILFSLSNALTQSAVNSFGKLTVAAHSVGWTFMGFCHLLITAGEQGVISFVGQNMGAQKYDRVKKTVNVALLFSAVTMIIFTTALVWKAEWVIGVFTKDAKVVEIGLVQFYNALSVYALYVPSVIYGGALRGMGKAILPTVINIIGICVLRVLWVTTVWPLNPTLEMVYYSFPLSWTASGIAMGIAYYIVKRKEFVGPKN